LLPRTVPRTHRGALPRDGREDLLMGAAKALSLFDGAILLQATKDSFRKLAPRHVAKNPVMFVVEIGSLLTTVLWTRDLLASSGRFATPAAESVSMVPLWFTAAVTLWLWFTVLFANFAEAVAEGRGKAQAESLRKMRKETTARRIVNGRGAPAGRS